MGLPIIIKHEPFFEKHLLNRAKAMTLEVGKPLFLDSYPETLSGSAAFLIMQLKLDKKTGIHDLSLKGAIIDVPFSPDTTAVSVELFFYMEKTKEWEECV